MKSCYSLGLALDLLDTAKVAGEGLLQGRPKPCPISISDSDHIEKKTSDVYSILLLAVASLFSFAFFT